MSKTPPEQHPDPQLTEPLPIASQPAEFFLTEFINPASTEPLPIVASPSPPALLESFLSKAILTQPVRKNRARSKLPTGPESSPAAITQSRQVWAEGRRLLHLTVLQFRESLRN